jgi:hypothetical protein
MGIDNSDNSLQWLSSVSNSWAREMQCCSRYPFIVGLRRYQARKGVRWVGKRDVCEYVVTIIL